MKVIFIEKSFANVMQKLVPDLFLKIKIEHISNSLMINSLKIYTVYFYSLPSWGLLKHTETKLQNIFFLPHIKLFWKIKRGQGLVFLPHFPDNFWRKIFLLSYYINWPSFIVWLALLREIMGNILIAIVC